MRLAPIVIPPHALVDGVVDTPGDVTIQGRIEGEVRSGETVTIIADATCVASISARIATIHGELIGNAVCTEAIRVGPGARVVGDLRAPEIQIDADAIVDGRVDLLPPEPREASIRRLPLTARGPAPTRPAAPPSESIGDPEPDFFGENTSDPGDIETTTERGLTDLPTTEVRLQHRRVPRPPRPRGRVRVAAKKDS